MATSIIVICVCFSSTALTLNISLFILMLRHTPRSFANYGIVMKFQVFVDITTNLAATMVMGRTIIIDNSCVFIAHGPCTLLSSSMCFYSCGIMIMGASMTIYIVLVSFIVRLQIMKNIKPSNNFIIVLLFSLSLPIPAAMAVIFLASRSEDEIVINILNEHLPEYGNSNNTIFGINDIHMSNISISLLLMIVMNIPLYFVILLLRSKIMQCLKETGDFLSDKTRKMHSQFATMLTQQCIIPPVVFVASLVPVQFEYLNLVRHPILETMINIFACLSTLLSPLIVIYHIVPYRRALVRWMEGREKKSLSTNANSSLFLARMVK